MNSIQTNQSNRTNMNAASVPDDARPRQATTWWGRLGLLMSALMLATVLVARAGEIDAPVQKHFDRLLTAVEKNDHARFVEEATPEFRSTPAQLLAGASKAFGPRLKKGYQADYLGSLKQQGHQVHLWKLTFKDGGDDHLARLALKNGKVAGFLFQ